MSSPITDPVLIFSLALFIILLAPMLLKRIKIPGVVALILSGVIVGPFGLNILARDSAIILFGTVGLLYIMFMAGLELDMEEFKRHRYRSLVFGLATFFIPFSVGFAACRHVFGFDFLQSLLTSCIFSSHTLVSYPILSRAGLAKTELGSVAVGGTVITDTLTLLVLAGITATSRGNLDATLWIRLLMSILLFAIGVFYGYPRIGRWFFKSIQGDEASHFIFVLALVFMAGFFAEVAGVEPIVGAFFAGLALNRLIPATSPLMSRIHFVGSALFIPFFLLSVGMLVNMRVLVVEEGALTMSLGMVTISLVGKFGAAWLTQKLCGYDAQERNLLYGLSASHAAATMAVVIVGFDMDIISSKGLNAAFLLILVSCSLSGFVTDNAVRHLARRAPKFSTGKAERILVSVSNPKSIDVLLDLAFNIRNAALKNPVYTLSVVSDDKHSQHKVLSSSQLLDKAVLHAAAVDLRVDALTRIDTSIPLGIARTAKEIQASDIVMGLSSRLWALIKLFGSVMENLLEKSDQTVWIARVKQPFNTFQRLVIVMPADAEAEPSFESWVSKLARMSSTLGVTVTIRGTDKTMAAFTQLWERLGQSITPTAQLFIRWNLLPSLIKEIKDNNQ
ncbi:MAG: cation:proton antiporter, partial [Planctomycetota bacterium]